MLQKFLKNYLYLLISIIVASLLITLFNYFNILSSGIINILKIIIPIIILFIGSINIGKVSNKKGYIEGIKYGGIYLVFIVIVNLICVKNVFSFYSLIYYLIIMIVSTFGSMIGINIKKRN